MRKRVYIHIGTGKTGTTALQSFCHANRDLLLDKGVLYPKVGISWNAHHALAWSLQEDCPVPEDERPVEISKITNEQLWGDLCREIEDSPANTALISSEHFSSTLFFHLNKVFEKNAFFNLCDIEQIKNYFSSFDVKIVVYLRRQDQLFQSIYNQRVKDSWVRGAESYEEIFEKIPSWLFDYEKLLSPWKDLFGKENLIVRVYEREQLGGNIYADFLGVMGYEVSPDFTLPHGLAEKNTSLCREALEFMKICNLLPLDHSEHRNLEYLLQGISDQWRKNQEFIEHDLIPQILQLGF